MSKCEWMFGDSATGAVGIAALAQLNPFRWSGPLTFSKARLDLRDVLQDGSRPIVVKIPANSSNSRRFETTQEAIYHLHAEDPVNKFAELAERRDTERKAASAAKEKAVIVKAAQDSADNAHAVVKAKEDEAEMLAGEEIKAREELEQAEKNATAKGEEAVRANKNVEAELVKAHQVKSEDKVEWMYRDAGTGFLGLSVAKKDPLRCSGGKSIDVIISQLEEFVENEIQRPIIVRKPPGLSGQEFEFDVAQTAIDQLFELCPLKKSLWDLANEARQFAKAAEDAATVAKLSITVFRENATKAAERTAASEAELSLAKLTAQEADVAVKEAAEAE